MVVACILVCCQAGKSKGVAEELKKTKGVKRAFEVHGRWDVAAEIEVADSQALGKIALKLHGLQGVKATETLIGF